MVLLLSKRFSKDRHVWNEFSRDVGHIPCSYGSGGQHQQGGRAAVKGSTGGRQKPLGLYGSDSLNSALCQLFMAADSD